MEALAIALGVVGAALVAALWDGARRALAAQVRQAELRVEAMQRRDLDSLAADVAAVSDAVAALRREHESLDKSIALGRRR